MGLSNSSAPQFIKDLTQWTATILTPNVQNGLFSLSGTLGAAYTATYSANAALSWISGEQLSLTEQSQFVKAMSKWSNVCKLTFSSDAIDPQIVLSKWDGDPTMIPNNFLNNKLIQSDVVLEEVVLTYSENSDGFTTMIHELGHAMGLSHPKEDGFHPAFNNSHSIMSYNDYGGIYAAGPMLYDIAAAQYLYGANTTYNAASTTYSGTSTNAATKITGESKTKITGESKLWCVWDAGGVDTFDFSAVTAAETGAKINLRGGTDLSGKVNFTEVGQEKIAIALHPANDNVIFLDKTA